MKLKTAVNRSLAALPMAAQDQGAAELARVQAGAIDDDPEALKKLGPHLLETLGALGLTPKARSSVVKGAVDGPRGKLAELRSLRP